MKCLLQALAGWLVTAALSVAAAQEPKICVLPVEVARPVAGAVPQKVVLNRSAFLGAIEGMSSPVFTPEGFEGRWKIDRAHRLVPYRGYWPIESYLDAHNRKIEAWSSRVVATTYGRGVSLLAPDADEYQFLAAGPSSQPYVLPNRKATIVIDGRGSIPMVVEDRGLRQWLSRDDMRRHGIGGVQSVHDSAVLGAVVVLDNASRLHVLTNDGDWHYIASVDRWDYGDVVDVPNADAAIYLGQKSVIAIRRRGPHVFVGETLASTSNNEASYNFLVSPVLGDLLFFGNKHLLEFRPPHWVRLGRYGFEEFNGPQPGFASKPARFKRQLVHDLPTQRRVLIEGGEGLFLLDGKSFTPLPDSGAFELGRSPQIFDLPSIGRVLADTTWGLFEITIDGRLRRIDAPDHGKFVDWAAGHAALTHTARAIYTVDRDLVFRRVELPEPFDRALLYGLTVVPRTSEVVISTSEGILLVTARRLGDGCPSD